MKVFRALAAVYFLLLSQLVKADTNPCSALMAQLARGRDESQIQTFVSAQRDRSAAFLWRNLNPDGTAAGVVVASPSRANPDYYYHWVRDASLSYEPVLTFYLTSADPGHRAENYRRLMEFANFSKSNQNAWTKTGLGEPKFHVDGRPYNDPWGRPQNDSQALRAMLFIRFAHGLMNEGKDDIARNELWGGWGGLIKRDLEDVAARWKHTCFDLWEEVNGQHFFTLMVQRKALLDGAILARRIGDTGAAEYYEKQAAEMGPWIESHWNPQRGYIEATREWREGINYKHSNLDTAVILGALKGDRGDGFFGPTHEKVLATAHRLRQTFQDVYEINKKGLWGTLIGRYSEDQYDGYETDGSPPGNPWPLLTLSFAELHYRAANTWRDQGEIPITEINLGFFQNLLPTEWSLTPGLVVRRGDPLFDRILDKLYYEGDSYLFRANYHAHPDFALNEQINRENGYMQGANHLTWNYAAQLTALFERRRR